MMELETVSLATHYHGDLLVALVKGYPDSLPLVAPVVDRESVDKDRMYVVDTVMGDFLSEEVGRVSVIVPAGF
ncbi:MAG: hypothetical protein AAGH79_05530 [Bacteroidota bacterium]